jgi:hypothetical protein
MVLSRNSNGYAITSRNYFSDLGSKPSSASASSVCEARASIDWRAFEFLLDEVNRSHSSRLWHGHRVFAFDGSYIDLPRCKECLEEFGTLYGSYRPIALLGVATNAFSGIPLACPSRKSILLINSAVYHIVI